MAVTGTFHSLETAVRERRGIFPESKIGKVNDREEYDELCSYVPTALQITLHNKMKRMKAQIKNNVLHVSRYNTRRCAPIDNSVSVLEPLTVYEEI